MTNTYFLDMIKTLRQNEEVILYQNILTISDNEKEVVIDFLQKEYEAETLNYPFVAPPFQAVAAIWAAEIVYYSAQLILYRQNKTSELEQRFPKLESEITASTFLSVDLCFRFIPDMLNQLKLIDSEDCLIAILEKQLETFHYSGINYPLKLEESNFEIIHHNKCLQQLYLNRIVTFKNLKLAKIPSFNQALKANFGIFENDFWTGFKTINVND